MGRGMTCAKNKRKSLSSIADRKVATVVSLKLQIAGRKRGCDASAMNDIEEKRKLTKSGFSSDMATPIDSTKAHFTESKYY